MLNCSIGTDSGPGGWPSWPSGNQGRARLPIARSEKAVLAGQRVGIAEEGADRGDIGGARRASGLACR